MRPVFVAGIGLWMPGYPSPKAWVEGRCDGAVTSPSCAILSSRFGRYTSLLTRMAVETVEQAAAWTRANLREIPTVFGSAYGEIQIAFKQLDMIEREGVPSPARFKNSVHNTASGHVSIATGNMGFSTALAAGRTTFAMCLMEAWAWLETHRGSIIVSIADEPLPDHLSSVGRYDPLGVAFHLSAEPPPAQSQGRLSGLRRRNRIESAARIPDRLAKNPCAVSLLLVEAVLRNLGGTVPVEIGGEGWSVDLQPREAAAS